MIRALKLAACAIARHVSYHRESYLFPLLAIAATLGAIRYVSTLTGRAVIDDPGAIVGFLYNFVGCVLVVVLTGWTVPHLVGDAKPYDPAWKHWIELCGNVFFASLFAYCLFH